MVCFYLLSFFGKEGKDCIPKFVRVFKEGKMTNVLQGKILGSFNAVS